MMAANTNTNEANMFFLFKVTNNELDNTVDNTDFIVEVGGSVDEMLIALNVFFEAVERAFGSPTEDLIAREIIPHNPPAKCDGTFPSYSEGNRYVIRNSGGIVAKGFT